MSTIVTEIETEKSNRPKIKSVVSPASTCKRTLNKERKTDNFVWFQQSIIMASTTKASNVPVPVMYLAHEDWSPRFDTFYTIKFDGYDLVETASSSSTTPATTIPANIQGKTNLPAYYYKIKIFCGHKVHTVHRRYSHFKWLYHNLPKSITDPEEQPKLILPPGTCIFQPQNNDAFATNRSQQLEEFLRDVLIRRGAAQHDTVATFLELNMF